MKTATLPTIGTLETDLPTPGDPTYQQEALALNLHKVLKELSDEGFVVNMTETSDLTAFSNDVADGVDDYMERYEDLLQEGASSVIANIPDVVSIIAALLSGGSEPVLVILLQGVLDVILRHVDHRTDEANGDPEAIAAIVAELEAINAKIETTGTEGIADVLNTLLEDIRSQIETTLNEFTINISGDDMSQSWSVGPSES